VEPDAADTPVETATPAVEAKAAVAAREVTPRAPRRSTSTAAPVRQAPSRPAPSVPGGLERPWPSRDPEPEASPATPLPAEPAAAGPETYEPAPPPVPEKQFEELIVSADSVIGLQVETTVTSETAKVEDSVDARVMRDVAVGDAVAIPAGSRAIGSITLVERGGKVKERARLGIRFHTLVLADGTRLPIRTETIYREGQAVGRESAAKIGGAAAGGAIIGAILGGKKGAAIGGAIGAAGGTTAVMAGDRSLAVVQSGSTLTVRLSDPVTVTVEK
jgi:hypothetical protein